MTYRDAGGRFALDPNNWWDPRLWDSCEPARIWLTDSVFALVDHEDHAAVVRVMWSLHSDGHTKLYARCLRQVAGRRRPIYLHRVIAERMASPPSPRHTYVDHLNGDGLDCRRANLRWVTPQQNRRNLRGNALWQGDLFQTSGVLV